MTIIKGLDEIRSRQTVNPPTHHDVRLAFPQYTSGWVCAKYHRGVGKWIYSYVNSREEVINHYDEHKLMCEMFPDILKWSDYSETYVYRSTGYINAKWALTFMITEEN